MALRRVSSSCGDFFSPTADSDGVSAQVGSGGGLGRL